MKYLKIFLFPIALPFLLIDFLIWEFKLILRYYSNIRYRRQTEINKKNVELTNILRELDREFPGITEERYFDDIENNE